MKSIKNEYGYFHSMPAKPHDVMNKIMGVFSEFSQPLLSRYGDDEITLMDDEAGLRVVFIREGCIDIWRNHDQLLVATAVGPAILGLQGSVFRYQTHTFKRQKNVDIHFLPLTTALEIIKEHGLVEDVMLYQSYINDQQAYRDFLMINNSAYSIICMLLTEIATCPYHKDVSVAQYISMRTRLARSGIMKILSDLRFGGFIEMEKGKLIRLCNPFPLKY
ncbi:helix-turn-helix domain-containing protein [Buttiauxella gaviniae]|uniref:Helix-turn-helix domain-containing protein n=1 Tax=Buttiauxella gaviniae TaxID=82990 RepID=A0ABV3NY84_9ENTR